MIKQSIQESILTMEQGKIDIQKMIVKLLTGLKNKTFMYDDDSYKFVVNIQDTKINGSHVNINNEFKDSIQLDCNTTINISSNQMLKASTINVPFKFFIKSKINLFQVHLLSQHENSDYFEETILELRPDKKLKTLTHNELLKLSEMLISVKTITEYTIKLKAIETPMEEKYYNRERIF